MSIERNFTVVCCALSLLLFFSPLLTIKVPIAGEQEVSGYDVFSKVNGLRRNLDQSPTDQKTSNQTSSPDSRAREGLPSSAPHAASPSARLEGDLPFSVQISWLIPIFIAAAFLFAVIGLVAALSSLGATRAACTVGACFAAAAILHIMVMNSDIHAWFSDSMKARQGELKGNPFAGFAEGFGSLIANAFQLKPGWGLFSLLVLLCIAAVFAFSRTPKAIEDGAYGDVPITRGW